MRVKQQAAEDLNQIMARLDDEHPDLSNHERNEQIVYFMWARGWLNLEVPSLLDTARHLGFTVIGDRIYPLDA